MSIDPKNYRVEPGTEVSDIDLDAEEFTLADGTRLTEERAAALAAKRQRNLIPGRKSLGEEGQHSPAVTFRTPRKAEAEALADELGIKVSELARRALDGVLDAHPKSKRFEVTVADR